MRLTSCIDGVVHQDPDRKARVGRHVKLPERSGRSTPGEQHDNTTQEAQQADYSHSPKEDLVFSAWAEEPREQRDDGEFR